jgi:hypothetical protein
MVRLELPEYLFWPAASPQAAPVATLDVFSNWLKLLRPLLVLTLHTAQDLQQALRSESRKTGLRYTLLCTHSFPAEEPSFTLKSSCEPHNASASPDTPA